MEELLIAKKIDDVDFELLMELYSEGNLENGEYFSKKKNISLEEGKKLSKLQFKTFLEDKFFKDGNNVLMIYSLDDKYISSVRLNYINTHEFYLEGLETHLEYRNKGYATKLYMAIFNMLANDINLVNNINNNRNNIGIPIILKCTINNRNIKSINLHNKLGFINTGHFGFSDFKNNLRNENSKLYKKIIKSN